MLSEFSSVSSNEPRNLLVFSLCDIPKARSSRYNSILDPAHHQGDAQLCALSPILY
jgi:hypothetical protein